jgi:hypothetical protein
MGAGAGDLRALAGTAGAGVFSRRSVAGMIDIPRPVSSGLLSAICGKERNHDDQQISG